MVKLVWALALINKNNADVDIVTPKIIPRFRARALTLPAIPKQLCGTADITEALLGDWNNPVPIPVTMDAKMKNQYGVCKLNPIIKNWEINSSVTPITVILAPPNLSDKKPPTGPKITMVNGMIDKRVPATPEDKPRALTR